MKRSLASLLILFSCASSAETTEPWTFDDKSCVATQTVTFPDGESAIIKYTSNAKSYLMAVNISAWELIEFDEPISVAIIFDDALYVKGTAHFIDVKTVIFQFPVMNSHDHLVNSAVVEIKKTGDGEAVIKLDLFGSEMWIPKIAECIISKNSNRSKTSSIF